MLVFAFLIGFFSLWYTNNLVEKLELQEREKISTWAEATKEIAALAEDANVNFHYKIIEANTTIPVILTDSNGRVEGTRNLDSNGYRGGSFLKEKIEEMKAQNEPIVLQILEGGKHIIYYENSTLLNQLRVYPYFQLGVIALFLAISYFAFSYSRTSEQNKVWAGMSKETAHQLGTPISSLMGWIDYLKESDSSASSTAISEMENDMRRLELITERFSKIGSEPALEPANLRYVLDESVDYINSRTSDKVTIEVLDPKQFAQIDVLVNRPLIAWVVENLCKNAVDAMDGKGRIYFQMVDSNEKKVQFDVVDSGKGVPSNKFKTIFKPGYTTKKRGWGLGLSLVKRIVENYHEGKIFVQSSEVGIGTRFRVELKRLK